MRMTSGRLSQLRSARAPSCNVARMTRPLRLEFAGALYHVTARGNRSNVIYRDDSDRLVWLEIIEQTCKRHQCIVHSYCQMGNHFHLMIETTSANLPQAMRHLNGLYSEYFNQRHHIVGHMFQGRYKAILVQRESYLLELSRYIVLNPVRAKIVRSIEEWPWSSFRYFVAEAKPPAWLQRDWLLSQFGPTHAQAMPAYCDFVLAGVGKSSPLAATRHRILLGDETFVSQYQKSQQSSGMAEAVMNEREAVMLTLPAYAARYGDRTEAMARAYLSTAFKMSQIAAHFGVSTKTVSRAVAAFEKAELTD